MLVIFYPKFVPNKFLFDLTLERKKEKAGASNPVKTIFILGYVIIKTRAIGRFICYVLNV